MAMFTRVNGRKVLTTLLASGEQESTYVDYDGMTTVYVSKGQATAPTLAMIDAAMFGSENQAGYFCEEFGFMTANVSDLLDQTHKSGNLDVIRLCRI